MVSRKQKFRTVILVLVLAALIVGGVFGISYFKGGVTFPWEVTSDEAVDTKTASDSKSEDSAIKEEPVEKEVKKEEPKPEQTTNEDEITEDEAYKTDSNSKDNQGSMNNQSSKSKQNLKSSKEDKDSEVEDIEMLSSGKLDYYGPLHVEDTQICDEKGNPVRLMGVSSHGLSWFPEFVSEESIKSLKDTWGINTIRLAMYTSDYNGYCVGGEDIQKSLKTTIDDAVNAATENDMYVIIDWHILNDNNPNEYKSQAIQFFGEMVRKYQDNENIIYEICNEPNGDTTWSDIKKYANEVIPVIRNVDKDAIILVGTPKWSSDLDSVMDDPLDYDNIMYTYHFYAGTHKSSQRNTLTEAVDNGLPVFVSEFGLVNADGNGSVNTSEAKKWKDTLADYNISCCIWNLSNKDEGSALIKADCTKTYGWTADDLTEEATEYLNWIDLN